MSKEAKTHIVVGQLDGHCKGQRECQCALCAVSGSKPLSWVPGPCGACDWLLDLGNSSMSKSRCTVIRTAAGPCSVCHEFVPEDLHVFGPEEETDGQLKIYCMSDCPEHGAGQKQAGSVSA